MVFDAAASTGGVSLNSSLLKGPDLLNDLPAVLFRFPTRRVGFIADIAEMFPQVQIRDDDIDSQRFLWREERCLRYEVHDFWCDLFSLRRNLFDAQEC